MTYKSTDDSMPYFDFLANLEIESTSKVNHSSRSLKPNLLINSK